jgi:hypothetical protein
VEATKSYVSWLDEQSSGAARAAPTPRIIKSGGRGGRHELPRRGERAFQESPSELLYAVKENFEHPVTESLLAGSDSRPTRGEHRAEGHPELELGDDGQHPYRPVPSPA